MDAAHVTDCFPELDAIGDDSLQAGVVDAWLVAADEGGVADLRSFPWLPPTERDLGIAGEETLVGHVRDVVACARALADALTTRRGTDVDRDLLVAGALVHDVSKLVEFDGMEPTPTYDLLGHPHYGVHLVAAAGLPVECSHIVLSHTSRTTVEPAFLEAQLVRRADEVAADAIRAGAVDDLREA
ncbi:HD domain-containing protein [Haloglomus litoreum]|uniref:HD domain-containing protein n=1 Tax=Haloglomus litoreum TaxID=3034026 RepID=UPI0023E88BF5|nr:HD domain-containing protein [Haloglomus sp. DT116]